MSYNWRQSAIGALLAIAVTTAMDAGGLSDFNAFPLLPLFVLFSYLQRLSRAEIGLTWGRRRDYGLAVFYPALVLGLLGVIAWMSGAVNLASTDLPKTWLNLAFLTLVTVVLALVTEEGFFRGWLWASLKRAGQTERGLLVWTSLAFAAWHVSSALLPTSFHPPTAQAPIYLLNAAVIGFIWGVLRQMSGSIVVTAVSHGVWNGLAYALFGVGPTLGALGIHNTTVFGPEVGLLGLALNLAFAAGLWQWYIRIRAIEAVEMTWPRGPSR